MLAGAILPALVSALAREKPNGIDEAGSSGSGVCKKVGKPKEVECKICLKTMTSNNLKRHMKTHDNKPCSIDVITENIENNSTVDGNEVGTNRGVNSKYKFVDKVLKRINKLKSIN